MNIDFFYKPPPDECFEELKSVCINFWKTFDDTFGYATEKINTIKDLPNEGANFMAMVQMIHPISRQVIAKNLSIETRNYISVKFHMGEDNEFDFFNVFKY
jgi:hypothetical protein